MYQRHHTGSQSSARDVAYLEMNAHQAHEADEPGRDDREKKTITDLTYSAQPDPVVKHIEQFH